MASLTRADLDDDLNLLKTEIIPFSSEFVDELMSNIWNTRQLPFRHHARDFLIGTFVQQNDSILITHNIRHFTWLPANKVYTPEEFLKMMLKV